jgi:hypothetical protein
MIKRSIVTLAIIAAAVIGAIVAYLLLDGHFCSWRLTDATWVYGNQQVAYQQNQHKDEIAAQDTSAISN